MTRKSYLKKVRTGAGLDSADPAQRPLRIETAKLGPPRTVMEAKYQQILKLGDPTLIGLLAGTIICIRLGCSSPQYAVRMGRHNIGLGYASLPSEVRPRQAQRQRRRAAARRRGGDILAFVEDRETTEMQERRDAAGPEQIGDARSAVGLVGEGPAAEPVGDVGRTATPSMGTSAEERHGDDLDVVWRVVSTVAEKTGYGMDVVKRVVDTLLEYLSVYPSVGVMRLAEDIHRYVKGSMDQEGFRALLSETLNALDMAGIVEVTELNVVNLRRRGSR